MDKFVKGSLSEVSIAAADAKFRFQELMLRKIYLLSRKYAYDYCMFDAKKTIDIIVEWIKEQMAESKTKGLVLGLSGGVDSAVCAVLAKRATTNVLGLLLPCLSQIIDLEYAMKVARKFSIETKSAELTNLFNATGDLVPKGNQLAYANIKPRLRMIVLYYYANLNNYLVVGTSNKTEISIGYFTKYGDGAGDIVPIGDLYKYQVLAVANELGIPGEVVKRPPSAGLWPGQTDEGEIGLSYEVIDQTLEGLEKGETEALYPTALEKIQSMIKQTEHKRQLPKICKIS